MANWKKIVRHSVGYACITLFTVNLGALQLQKEIADSEPIRNQAHLEEMLKEELLKAGIEEQVFAYNCTPGKLRYHPDPTVNVHTMLSCTTVPKNGIYPREQKCDKNLYGSTMEVFSNTHLITLCKEPLDGQKRGVLRHEICHIALGHKKRSNFLEYYTREVPCNLYAVTGILF